MNLESVLFEGLSNKAVIAKFDQDHASSDGGAILLKACDERLRLSETLAAVLARVAPTCVRENLRDLWRIKWQVEDSPSVYLHGAELSIELQHHLFETLYHAIANHTQAATLITADDRYFAKRHGLGRIQRLVEFSV